MSVDFSFAGKTVLITGASSGIGFAIADGFAKAGATLFILAENDAVHEAAATLSERYGREIKGLQCDIAERDQVQQALGQIAKIDVLINNAGYQPMTPIRDTSEKVEADIRRIIDVNVMGAFNVSRAALPRIPRGGRIIFTSSIWGRTGEVGFAAYAASKHAVLGIMRSLAMELGPDGITVNAVAPGWVETDGALAPVRAEAEAAGISLEQLVEQYLKGQPIPGMMPPSSQAGAFLFLASDAAADITGQVLGVDRGSFIG
ncbi:SDR family NAD(P)-dependent oxidoreductase [Methyloligella sp. 2.7D]|uniref:SDR family NAD(P)-dependent oxidoreductase n=1 Tax=unclassified Methyloligella TaxID=2625955 RepID=UPI00157CD2F8|nr:SDR family NAD(P)-dependent oxidoreductase [Methyloligella sp. GL2]QKP77917.1 SDR family oxidoreductase [Methyloligella sp. GL2]